MDTLPENSSSLVVKMDLNYGLRGHKFQKFSGEAYPPRQPMFLKLPINCPP